VRRICVSTKGWPARRQAGDSQYTIIPMPREATIPAETDVLCESCGYVLNGLPPDSRCPECGRPAAESDPALRTPTAWEQTAGDGFPSAGAFLSTSAAVLFRPSRFYRKLATRTDSPLATTFAQIYWSIAAVFFGLAAWAHATWFIFHDPGTQLNLLACVGVAALAYIFLVLTNRLAAWLTHWEASYRGLRLTLPVVRRGLQYHAVHYVPVAIAAAVTVVLYGHLVRRGRLDPTTTTTFYLYTLSAEVILAALYLFVTYWAAMRNMMYANA
jgi:hypothetical protein